MRLFKRQAPAGSSDGLGSNNRGPAANATASADSRRREPLARAWSTAHGAPLGVASWPSGAVRFDGETLEFGAGETRRVHISCLREIEIEPPRRGRSSLAIAYQAGLGKEKTGLWIETGNEAALSALVAAVRAAMPRQG